MQTVEMDVLEIDIVKVRPNLRCVYDEERIAVMVQSMRLSGQVEPIHVWFTGEHFRILDGEKRWRACKRLGLKKIRAAIVEVLTSN